MSYDLFFYSSSYDEDEVNSELAFFTEACSAAIEVFKPKRTRSQVEKDRYGAHDRLVAAYFSEHPQYDEATFRTRISISAMVKCTCNLSNGVRHRFDALDEYLQMGATTTRENLVHFCNAVMELYGREGGHGPDPFILLEAIASQDLWIWHAFFGVSGMNNDVNVLWQSPIFNDLKIEKAPDVPFVANDVAYKKGYYLTGRIYPEWSVLIKSIKNPRSNDQKRIMYKTAHEAARKDMERAFGVLKMKWKIIKQPARGFDAK
ncbi:ALP1-like protein [Tanacetum coccineum]